MKNTKGFIFSAVWILLVFLSGCSEGMEEGSTSTPSVENISTSITSSQSIDTSVTSSQPVGQIYLLGEMHGVKKILDREVELWSEYYNNEGMRHLFVEFPYYTAELLNQWMQSDNDTILDEIYNDWKGSAAYNPDVKEFLKQIKLQCPETIFHGTDVGHQYKSTGERFLQFLRDNNQEESEQYKWAQEVIEQGKYYYDNEDEVYRENKMVENFIREFDKLNGENVMGIYGGAHVEFEAMDYITQSVGCMANQLKEYYGDAIHSENLAWMVKDIDPLKIDVIEVNGKEYQASYFGKSDLTGFEDYAYREFWRLENAYDDFKGMPKSGNVLPYDNYPMQIEAGQIFVIDYTKTDGTVTRGYYCSEEGHMWEGMPSTEEIIVE